MTADGSGVGLVPQSAPENGSDWTFDEAGSALTAAVDGSFLAVDSGADNELVMASSPAAPTFEPATGCAVYPEMPLGVIGQTYTGNAINPCSALPRCTRTWQWAARCPTAARMSAPRRVA